jgi:hypothetical protein
MVSQPVCLGFKPHVGSNTTAGLYMWGAFFDERTGLSFTIVAGPRQHSRPYVRILRDLSQSRPPILYGRVPYLFPSGKGWSKYNPRHWIPL